MGKEHQRLLNDFYNTVARDPATFKSALEKLEASATDRQKDAIRTPRRGESTVNQSLEPKVLDMDALETLLGRMVEDLDRLALQIEEWKEANQKH